MVLILNQTISSSNSTKEFTIHNLYTKTENSNFVNRFLQPSQVGSAHPTLDSVEFSRS